MERGEGRERQRACGFSTTSVCVSSISKMRSDAAIACCRLAFTRLSFFAGPYIRNSVAMNDVSSPIVSRPLAISRLPYQSAPAMPKPPSNSISGGRLESAAVTFMLVRNSWWPARANRSAPSPRCRTP